MSEGRSKRRVAVFDPMLTDKVGMAVWRLPERRAARKRSAGRFQVSVETPSRPAHTSSALPTPLNADWRVADDPLQWLLQRRRGHPRKKATGWITRSYCATREGLQRCVAEHCGEIDADASEFIESLPDFHPDWGESR